jgi:UDP-glucose 4-epimerase
LARRLVTLGAEVLLVDGMIPEYGGNPANIDDTRDQMTVNIGDIRGGYVLRYLLGERDFLFNLAAQTSHLDSMAAPGDDRDQLRGQLQLLEALSTRVSPSSMPGRARFMDDPIISWSTNAIHCDQST